MMSLLVIMTDVCAPPLLHLTVANLVTAGALWSLLNICDASTLRCVHPSLRDALTEVPWHWERRPVKVVDVRRFAICIPRAMCKVRCENSASGMLKELPFSVKRLILRGTVCDRLPEHLNEIVLENAYVHNDMPFKHMTALQKLCCDATIIHDRAIATLPASLIELILAPNNVIRSTVSFAHLSSLKKLCCKLTSISDETIATLPASLIELNVQNCSRLTPSVTFAHLPMLRKLNCTWSSIGDSAITTLPASLIELEIKGSCVTRSVSFIHLSMLEKLNCEWNSVDDKVLHSLPYSLKWLNIRGCWNVTATASLAHLTMLTTLDCSYTSMNVSNLPLNLHELDITTSSDQSAISFARFRNLNRLCAGGHIGFDDASLASLSTEIRHLDVHWCGITEAASFAHLILLEELYCMKTNIGNKALFTLPPSVRKLNITACEKVTSNVIFNHLPALQLVHMH